jgi:hypothetical protein
VQTEFQRVQATVADPQPVSDGSASSSRRPLACSSNEAMLALDSAEAAYVAKLDPSASSTRSSAR